MNRVDLISVDCWDTILKEHPQLDSKIEHLIYNALLNNCSSFGVVQEITSAIERERSTFRKDLARADKIITPQDRINSILQLLGNQTVTGWVDELISVGQAIDSLLVDFPPAVMSGVDLLFENARRLNIPVAVVSNTGWVSGDAVKQVFLRYGLNGYIKYWLFSGDGYYPKPHPQMFEALLKEHECAATNVVHIGDNPATDMEGAQSVGITSMILTQVGALDGWPEKSRPINSLSEAWHLIEDGF